MAEGLLGAAYIVSFVVLGFGLIIFGASTMRFSSVFRAPPSLERTKTLRTASITFMLVMGVPMGILVFSRVVLWNSAPWPLALAIATGLTAICISVMYSIAVFVVRSEAQQLDALKAGEIPPIESGFFICKTCGFGSNGESKVIHRPESPDGVFVWQCSQCNHVNTVDLSTDEWLRSKGAPLMQTSALAAEVSPPAGTLDFLRNPSFVIVFGLLAAMNLWVAFRNYEVGWHASAAVSLFPVVLWGAGALLLARTPLVRLRPQEVVVFKNVFKPRSLAHADVTGVVRVNKRAFLLLRSGEKVEVPLAWARPNEREPLLTALEDWTSKPVSNKGFERTI